ncbi:MAG TPA: MFS transporter [Polyangia bacterium]|nr:MFS transporter [Polyangia bacterium]
MTDSSQESPRAVAWALAPGTLLAGVAGGIAFPILPIAAARVGLPVVFIGAILAANRAMRVVSSPWVGLYADRNGCRRTLLVGLMIQIVVLLLYALGIVTRRVGPLFLIGRLLHGPGSACVFVSAQALALHSGGRSTAGRAAGIVRASIVLGVPVGLAVGGLLSDAVGDAAAFTAAAGAVLLALIVAYVRVPDLRAPIAQNLSFKARLLAMRDRRLVALGALNLVVNFAAAGMILTTLALLVRERHLSLFGRNLQGTSGLLMGIMIVSDAATTPFVGRLGDRFHAHARVAAASMAALVAGLVVVGLSTGIRGIAAGLALIGVGAAGLGPSLLVLMGALVPRDRRATGVGLMQFCGDLGGTLGPLVGTALLVSSTSLPYLGTAALVVCSIPLALWLARLEARAVAVATRPL